MIIKEFRIVLPMTVEEFRVGQLWSVAESSRRETGGGDGVQVFVNQPYSDFPLLKNQFSTGQYTKKKYFFKNKVNGFIRTMAPAEALVLNEEAWNAYPYCKTVVTNDYIGKPFSLVILSYHLPGAADRENVHELPPEMLKQREVVVIDIADTSSHNEDLLPEEDPTVFKSSKTGRGPLSRGWMNKVEPVMTCYKLVIVEFKKFGLQRVVENKMIHFEERLFLKFHRQVFVWIDNWINMTMEDIRTVERSTHKELDKARSTGQIRGQVFNS